MKRIAVWLIWPGLLACTTIEQNSDPQPLPVEIAAVVEQENIDESIVLAQQRALDRIEAKQSTEKNSTQNNTAMAIGLKIEEPKYLMDTKDHLPKVQKWIRF